jgi:hypothetical protein
MGGAKAGPGLCARAVNCMGAGYARGACKTLFLLLGLHTQFGVGGAGGGARGFWALAAGGNGGEVCACVVCRARTDGSKNPVGKRRCGEVGRVAECAVCAALSRGARTVRPPGGIIERGTGGDVLPGRVAADPARRRLLRRPWG